MAAALSFSAVALNTSLTDRNSVIFFFYIKLKGQLVRSFLVSIPACECWCWTLSHPGAGRQAVNCQSRAVQWHQWQSVIVLRRLTVSQRQCWEQTLRRCWTDNRSIISRCSLCEPHLNVHTNREYWGECISGEQEVNNIIYIFIMFCFCRNTNINFIVI